MRLLAGQETAEKGTISQTFPNLRIGYLAQGFDLPEKATIQTSLSLFTVDAALLEAEIASLAIHPASILAPLGLADLPLETPIQHLSRGQKTRLALARILLEEPHLLLLDEPTNHLDIAMLEWLENWVRNFKGAALIVSHDRAFLDNTVSGILELDPQTHQLKAYPGSYSNYTSQKQAEFEHQTQAYLDQQQQIAQLRAAANHVRSLTKMKKGGKADGGDKFARVSLATVPQKTLPGAQNTSKPA